MSALDDILPAPLTETGGLVEMAAAEYHADPCPDPSLSSSVAKILLDQSPAHARVAHPRLNPNFEPDNDTKFDLGTVAHEILLEGESAVWIVDHDDWRSNAAKEIRDKARAAGRTPLLAKDWVRVEAMANAARRQLEMLDLDPPPITDGHPELCLTWMDEGIWCRARFDWLHDDLSTVDDLKTTGASAYPQAWAKTMFGFGGDFQAAFYLRGLRKALGADAKWRFIVQEDYPPYALSIVTLSAEVLAFAAERVDIAIRRWAECIADQHWPAYTREPVMLELPSWKTERRPVPAESFGSEAPF